jgi:hypothetical protein
MPALLNAQSSSVSLERGGHHRRNVGRLANVGPYRDRFAAGVSDQLGGFFDTFRRNVGNGDLSALASEQHGAPATDAARSTGNENNLSFKHSGHSCLLFDLK